MFVLLLLFIGLGSISFAQNVEPPVTTSIKSMLEDAKNSKYKTVEEFLSSLPESMKSNFIFMGESQSLQKASKEFPRVILTSVYGDVRVTFNTDPKTKGYNKVEVSYWDDSNKKFEYNEVEFNLVSKKSKVHGNQACINCHGNPSKPNWDTYNYWAGAIPFNKDGLVKDTKELTWYLELLKKTDPKTGDSRLKILKPVDSPETIKSMVDKRGFYLRKYLDDQGKVTDQGDFGGLGNFMFSTLLSKQGEAVTKRLRGNENFESIKYFLAGLFIGCEDMSAFSPQWYQSAANNYFKSTFRDENIDKSYDETLQKIVGNTRKRQRLIRDLKIQRQKDFLFKQLGSVSEVEMELKKNIDAIGLNVVGIQPGKVSEIIGEGSMLEGDNDPEKTSTIARYRYFLEPLGVNVESFSLSFDSGTFSFADAFESISFSLETSTYDEILKELKLTKFRGTDEERMNVCGTLGKASSIAMNSSDLKVKAQKYYDATCKPINKEPIGIQVAIADDLVEKIVIKNCSYCHAGEEKSNYPGAKSLPFDNIKELKKLIDSPSGRMSGFAERIYDRLNRPEHYPRIMPLGGGMDPVEKKVLSNWLSNYIEE